MILRSTTKLADIVPIAARYLESVTGIHIPEYRYDVIEKALRQLGGGNTVSGLQVLMSDDSHTKAAVLEVIAISETYFFRHSSHFDALKKFAEAAKAEDRGFHVLSAGCSTGEEAWSAAAVLADVYGSGTETNTQPRGFTVSGWDLCPHRLAFAKEGRYRPWSFRQGMHGYERYFSQQDGNFQVGDSLRKYVQFSCVNLTARESLPDQRFDVILFRNVSIYWSAQQAADSTAWLTERLRDGGIFIPGPSDPGFCQGEGWERISAGDYWAYRKTHRGPTKPLTATALRTKTKAASPKTAFHVTSGQGIVRTPRPSSPPSGRAAARNSSAKQNVGIDATATTLLAEAKKLADEGASEAALNLLLKLKVPYPAEVRQLEGILLFSLGKYKAAADAFRKCVYLDTENAACRNWLAMSLREIGAHERADREIRNAKLLQEPL